MPQAIFQPKTWFSTLSAAGERTRILMVPCKSWVVVERPSRWQLSIDPGLPLVNEMRESEFADTLRRKVQSSRLVVVFPAVGPNTCSMASPGLKVVRQSGYWLSLNLSTEEERLRDGPGDHRSPPQTRRNSITSDLPLAGHNFQSAQASSTRTGQFVSHNP